MTDWPYYLGAVIFAFVAMWCAIRIASHGYQQPKGTLWPDGEQDERPVKHIPSPVPFAKRPIPLTDLERRQVAERIVGITRGH